MKTDVQLNADVLEELRWDPTVTATDINVATDENAPWEICPLDDGFPEGHGPPCQRLFFGEGHAAGRRRRSSIRQVAAAVRRYEDCGACRASVHRRDAR